MYSTNIHSLYTSYLYLLALSTCTSNRSFRTMYGIRVLPSDSYRSQCYLAFLHACQSQYITTAVCYPLALISMALLPVVLSLYIGIVTAFSYSRILCDVIECSAVLLSSCRTLYQSSLDSHCVFKCRVRHPFCYTLSIRQKNTRTAVR